MGSRRRALEPKTDADPALVLCKGQVVNPGSFSVLTEKVGRGACPAKSEQMQAHAVVGLSVGPSLPLAHR